MSELGKVLAASADSMAAMGSDWARGARIAFAEAASVSDDYERAALALSAEGRGPHAAAALKYARSVLLSDRSRMNNPLTTLERLIASAEEAEQ